MSDKAACLIEIGVEELPLQAPKSLSVAFAKEIENRLNQEDITFERIEIFATPRRLALLIHNCARKTKAQRISRKGPALSAAFTKEGKPTPAAEGFARSCGVAVEKLTQIVTSTGAWLTYTETQTGKPVEVWLPELVESVLDILPIPKLMRWGSGDEHFIRPVRWLTLMFGKSVIPATLYGCTSQGLTWGHRFHHPTSLPLASAEEYEKVLKQQGYVIPSFYERLQTIEAQLKHQEKIYQCHFVTTEALLELTTSLVEWPIVLIGTFAEGFLKLPPEALISVMNIHQKAFHAVNETGELQPYFAFVSNLQSKEVKRVIHGNQRVMKARLADAAFFYEKDQQIALADRVASLDHVTFQANLGTLKDKAHRLVKLAKSIAVSINSDLLLAERAALLAKADLVTDIVGEFPELQGVMGSYYALHDHEDPQVASAIKEHYYPRFGGDDLPSTPLGCCIALADKLDTLTSIFSVGKIPTGDKDPFGLRRASLGILRIIIEQELPLDLETLLSAAIENLPSVNLETTADLKGKCLSFLLDRLRVWYHTDYSPEVVNAVMALNPTSPLDFHERVRSVHDFYQLPQAAALIAANKRVIKLLTKSNSLGQLSSLDEQWLQEPAEKDLARLLENKNKQLIHLLDNRQYSKALQELAELQPAIDRFFTEVMVMVPDVSLQQNRLALLSTVCNLFLQVADISQLQ